MENASKALFIAGAILLSILIIAIGMYIYNSSTNSIYSAGDQIASQEQESFNSQWTSYDENQPGSSIKNMIAKLISNAKVNAEEQSKLPDLAIFPTKASADGDGYIVKSNVDKTNIKGFNAARSKIETKHNYFVELHYSAVTGLVDMIVVHYNEPEEVPTLDDDSYDDVEGSDDIEEYKGETGDGKGSGGFYGN